MARPSKQAQPLHRSVRVTVTVGELIAAAFEALGEETNAVAEVLSSRAMTKAAGRKILLV